MSKPHDGHGYIDFVGDEEHFWRIETLWTAAEGLPVREVPLDEIDAAPEAPGAGAGALFTIDF